MRAVQLVEAGRELAQLLLALQRLALQHVQFRQQRLMAGAVQRTLVARDFGCVGQDLGGECDVGLVDLGTQPAERAEQRQMALAALAQLARRTHVVDAHEDLAALDDRALAHQERSHDAPLEVLHHLDLARGDHLAIAPGDLLQRGPARPGQEDGEEGRDREQEKMGEAARGLQIGTGATEYELRVGAPGPAQWPLRGRRGGRRSRGGARHVRSAPGCGRPRAPSARRAGGRQRPPDRRRARSADRPGTGATRGA